MQSSLQQYTDTVEDAPETNNTTDADTGNRSPTNDSTSTYDITPGTYRNTNTGVEFTVELDDGTGEVIMHDTHGATDLEIRKNQGNFWFNTLDATGPTYELLEPAEANDDRNDTPSSGDGDCDDRDVAGVNIDGMVFETDADGWSTFPHPENIHAHLDDDMDADQATFPSHVQDAIDELTDDPSLGEFLVFDAEAAYEYLETLQKQSDLHLENFHRRQLIRDQLSGGRGYAKGSSLSTYDKKWICEWEVRRRLADADRETWTGGVLHVLDADNTGLPGADR